MDAPNHESRKRTPFPRTCATQNKCECISHQGVNNASSSEHSLQAVAQQIERRKQRLEKHLAASLRRLLCMLVVRGKSMIRMLCFQDQRGSADMQCCSAC